MKEADAVTKYAATIEQADRITMSLARSLWNSKHSNLRGLVGHNFVVYHEIINAERPTIWYHTSEQRQLNHYGGMIYTARYSIADTRIAMIQSTSDVANLIMEIRQAFNNSFRTYQVAMPVSNATSPYVGVSPTAYMPNTTAGDLLYQTSRPFEQADGHAEIIMDPGSLTDLLIAVGKLKSHEEIEEERVLESIKRSVLGQ